MIKQNQVYLNRLNAATDFLLVFFAYLFSAWFRLKVLHGWWRNQGLSTPMIIASAFYAAGLLLMLAALGYYSTTRVQKLTWKLGTLFISTTISIFIVTTVIFVFKIEDVSRGIILIFYVLTLFLLGGKQILMRLVLNQLRAGGFNIKHEILVGTGKLAAQYKRDLSDEPELGIQVDASISPEADLETILSSNPVDEVVIALEPEEYIHITRLIEICEKNGVKFLVIPFYNDMIPAHPVFESIGNSKLINMRANRMEQIGWAWIKRGFDIIASAIGLVVLSPLFLFLAIGVKLSSPGPILFKQVRVGYKQKQFQMLKFRSMRVNEESDTAWSSPGDVRRTKFGIFMRNTSLDELPQLINVLRGDMSLVGPRPELPYFVEKFKETIPLYMVKHQVKPGITGWAQINGYRGDTSIKKRIELDLWYIDNWSPWLDLKILFRTVPFGMLNWERIDKESTLDVKVIVATHKPYWMPADPLYVPVQVGAEGKADLGFTPDNTGDNISSRNANYCELTGLYWAWKNLKADYIGLAHYRRQFTFFSGTNDRRDCLSLDQARQMLASVDVLLPAQRNYWIETNYQQYVHAHHAEDLDETKQIISEKYPEYLNAYERVMKKTTGHRFNMFIMKKQLMDKYCTWLFDILFELEKRLDISNYSANDKRVFGFVSERLLDVWLETNRVKYKDIPYIFLEKENWITKIANFLKRKLEGGKQDAEIETMPADNTSVSGKEMLKSTPFVSVIVPAYNAENTIKSTISDLVAQTYENFEIVIVDDGSTDRTPAICDEYEDKRIRVVHQVNGGLSNARNNGTKSATGDYVTFVDSDDRVEKDFLQELVDALVKTGADISCGRIDRVKEGEVPVVGSSNPRIEVFNRKQTVSEMLTGKKIWVGACCRLIPRQWILEEPFLEGKYYEDLSNTYRVNLKTENLAFVDKDLYHYVMHGGSITARRKPTKKQCLEYYEAIDLCSKGCLNAFPDLQNDVAVLMARDYMSLFLHIRRCDEKDAELAAMEKEIASWMKKNWRRAAGDRKAPRNVRMRTMLCGISPWLYEKIYYVGIKFTGKRIE